MYACRYVCHDMSVCVNLLLSCFCMMSSCLSYFIYYACCANFIFMRVYERQRPWLSWYQESMTTFFYDNEGLNIRDGWRVFSSFLRAGPRSEYVAGESDDKRLVRSPN